MTYVSLRDSIKRPRDIAGRDYSMKPSARNFLKGKKKKKKKKKPRKARCVNKSEFLSD